MQFILIPLDNRPVTYIAPQIICRVAGIQALTPSRELFGTLSKATHYQALSAWLMETIKNNSPERLLFCLDTLIYGGLINSRRSNDSESDILNRSKEIKSWKKLTKKPMAVLAQASIMRISDNYDNTEEKTYWAKYGREIFNWSELLHKNSTGTKLPPGTLNLAESRIDPVIKEDYLKTRRRNFKASMHFIDLVQQEFIDFLAFSQDDSGQYGLNVLEKEKLIKQALTLNVSSKILCYPGSDETLQTLIARSLLDLAPQKPKVSVAYTTTHGALTPSLYEGQSIGDSIRNQANAAGLTIASGATDKLDLQIIVHCAENKQGDHVFLPGLTDLRQIHTAEAVQNCLKLIKQAPCPVILCDVAYTNGSDPALISELMKDKGLLNKLWAYAGWNTAGNTTGSAIALGVARWFSSTMNTLNATEKAWQEAMFIRFADDWAYQTQVRPRLNGQHTPDNILQEMMQPFLTQINTATPWQIPSAKVTQPWQRSFEIEVTVNH